MGVNKLGVGSGAKVLTAIVVASEAAMAEFSGKIPLFPFLFCFVVV